MTYLLILIAAFAVTFATTELLRWLWRRGDEGLAILVVVFIVFSVLALNGVKL